KGEMDPLEYARKIRRRVWRCTGIPVSIGVATSKTLAKLASKKAKKSGGAFCIDEVNLTKILESCQTEGVWGIGRRHALKLQRWGIMTAADLVKCKNDWLLSQFPVTVLRTVEELRGLAVIPFEDQPESRKSVCSSRSFKKELKTFEELSEALLTFVARAAEKLRHWELYSQGLSLFIQTSPFGSRPKYVKSVTVQLPVATADTTELGGVVLDLLKKVFKNGYAYKKAGVVLLDLVPEKGIQPDMFDTVDREKRQRLMLSMDKLNQQLGRDTVRTLGSGTKRQWATKRELLSKRYTTCWSELLEVK
ncbi:MAG: DUF4113 domain-containing protein, partial [Lentisphaeraceae bacterium]|nr:DUF4113 domain-containing protein [Lentisphaeraceae bacterium]